MDKQTLVKMVDLILAPILPKPAESGGIGSLLSGGGLMAAMEQLKTIQQLIAQGGVAQAIVDALSPETLDKLDEILMDSGYVKE